MEKKKNDNPEEFQPVGNWKILDVKEVQDQKCQDEELFKAKTKIYRWFNK